MTINNQSKATMEGLERMPLTLALREAKLDHQVLAYNVIRLLMAQAAAMGRGRSARLELQAYGARLAIGQGASSLECESEDQNRTLG